MFNPRHDEDFEWLELYNDAGASVSVAGWTIAAVSYTFPAGASIPANGYVVVAANPDTVQKIYSLSTKPFGPWDTSHALDNNGEKLTLKDAGSTTQASVQYDNKAPWPSAAQGFGATIECACFKAPQSTAQYWFAGPVPVNTDINKEYGGTPGKAAIWNTCMDQPWINPHQVFITEIMYGPSQSKTTSNTQDHEYLEIYNNDAIDIDIGNWRIVTTGDAQVYQFAPGTIWTKKTFITIVKNKSKFSSVYTSVPGLVVGPTIGDLGSGTTGLAVLDGNGFAVDYVEYDSEGSWPAVANELGASQKDLFPTHPLYPVATYNSHKYKGYSLSRRSLTWPTNSAYNWRAALPTPGAANLDASSLPNVNQPDISPSEDKITKTTTPKIKVSLKPIPIVAGQVVSATLTWFKDNIINAGTNTPASITMTYSGDKDGEFNATIPAQPDNAVIRYYVVVTMQGGVTKRMPRPDDPYQYYSYFVEPPPEGNTPSPRWHLIINRKKWSELFTNINFPAPGTSRVTDSCTLRATWDATVPVVIGYKGKVYDVDGRYQGSRWNRKNGVDMSSWPGLNSVGPTPDTTLRGLSWRLKFKSYDSGIGGNDEYQLSKMWQGCTMYQTPLAFAFQELYGVTGPDGALSYRFARININGVYWRYMHVIALDTGDKLAKRVTKRCLDQPAYSKPHIFKDKGSNVEEAAYSIGDFRPINAQCSWTPTTRYEYTYSRKTYDSWGTSTRLSQLITQNAALTSSNGATWLSANIELNWMLSFHATINFAGTWDNTFQNQWFLIGLNDNKLYQGIWDADRLFGEASGPTQRLDAGVSGYQTMYLRNSIIQYIFPQLQSRMRLLVATIFSDATFTPIWNDIVAEFNETEANACAGGWTVNFATCRNTIQSFFPARRNYVDSSWGKWANIEKSNAANALKTLTCPTVPTLTRVQTVYTGAPGEIINPGVVSKTFSKLEINWTIPVSWGVPITGYKITYTVDGGAVNSVDLPGTALGWVLPNPGSGKTYAIKVNALSSLGTGNTANLPPIVTDSQPVDCVWGAWSAFGACNATCAGGWQNQTRTNTPASNGGMDCTGPAINFTTCNTQPCPIDCTWNAYGPFGACNATCGGGKQNQTRTQNPAQFGGKACSGSDTNFGDCNTQPCPIDCTWNSWSAFGACNVTCGGGIQNQTRTQNAAQFGGLACTGPAINFTTCNTQNCPIDCTWNAFGPFGGCNATCGGGVKTQTRTQNPAQFGGKNCTGSPTNSTPCNTQACPVDCTWNPWSAFGACNVTCGGGIQNQTRSQNAAQFGGMACTGPAINFTTCNTQNCPIDCTWNAFGPFGGCNQTCGGGKQNQTRTQNPAQFGGAACKGSDTNFTDCNTQPCPIDCTWNAFGSFGACNRTCGGGKQNQTRTQNPAQFGGKACSGSDTNFTDCNTQPCPIDCTWNAWGPFNPCNVSCGGGTKNQTRTQNPAQFGGKDCVGPDTNSTACNTQNCPIDCTWNPFGAWSSCNATCGGGNQTQTRTNNPAQFGGLNCTGAAEQTRACNTQPCPIDCTWNAFGPWGPCNATCNGGTQIQTRTENPAMYGGKNCTGDSEQSQPCNTQKCPIDCTWNPFGPFGECDRPCGGGKQNQTRTYHGAAFGGKNCTGSDTNFTDCNTQPCPIDCVWNEWGAFGICNATCNGGIQTQTRTQVPALYGGLECTGPDSNSTACNTQPCPIHCTWNPWGPWTNCTEVCGGGNQTQTRTKNDARDGGTDCLGSDTAWQICNNQPCPVDCVWSEWSEVSACSATCGPATQSSTRTQLVMAQFGGVECSGPNINTTDCNQPPCPIDCTWSEWDPWGECSKPCGNGTQTRARKSVPEKDGGAVCDGSSTMNQGCNPTACPVDCVWSEWGPWTNCSVTCGSSGTITQTRVIASPAVGSGKPCTGPTSNSESCEAPACPSGCEWAAWSVWTNCPSPCGGNQTRTRTMNSIGGADCGNQLATDLLNCPLCGRKPPTKTPPEEEKKPKWPIIVGVLLPIAVISLLGIGGFMFFNSAPAGFETV